MKIPFIARRKNITLDLFRICYFLLILVVTGCGDDYSSSDDDNDLSNTGSYACSIKWPEDVPTLEIASTVSRTIDCDTAGVATVAFTFYDGSGSYLTGDEWSCSLHEGTVHGIPTGNDRRLVVTGEGASGIVLYRGEETGVTIVAGQTTQGGEIDMEPNFKLISAGTFTMGSPTDEPGRDSDETQHEGTLTKSFYIQTTEVTQGQWKAVMGENPSSFEKCGDDCPVETVSWNDVQEFIEQLNQMEGTDKYRLPTEAEWEYACRAGSTTAFAKGGITETECGYDPNLDAMGWYCGNSDDETHPVAQKDPNDWGLYDMHGNVWEWCQDLKGEYPSSPVSDPTGASSGTYRVLRGGSWPDKAMTCRSAKRLSIYPERRGYDLGFRVARDF